MIPDHDYNILNCLYRPVRRCGTGTSMQRRTSIGIAQAMITGQGFSQVITIMRIQWMTAYLTVLIPIMDDQYFSV